MNIKKIVVATNNRGKVREVKEILSDFGIEVLARDEAGVPEFEVEETGETFEENSLIKARAILRYCDCPVLADDSGLEVDCLGGAPGVYSARFGGEEGNFEKNNRKLTEMLREYPEEERTGRFVCVMTLIVPGSGENSEKSASEEMVIVTKGTVEGHLLTESRGENGFGYDPLFVPGGCDRTFAEMSSDEKNSLSHRGKALRMMKEKVQELG